MTTLLLTIMVLINITSGGLPIVNMYITLHEPAYLINITLPTSPIDKMIYVRDQCNGNTLPYTMLNSDYIQILNVGNCSKIEISYIAMPNITNTSIGLTINVKSTYNNTILTWSKNIVIIPTENEIYYMKFISQQTAQLEKGHKYYIRYLILLPLSESTKNIQAKKSSGNSEEKSALYIILIILLATIDVVLWPLFIKTRRIRRKTKEKSEEISISEELSEVEKRIVEIIKERGGSVLQSELYKILGIPRTTLWRAVKRLEEKGIVRIEKVNRLNKIVLVKDLEK